MVDIQVKPHLDLTQKAVQERLLSKIASGEYFAVLISPPCSTFSRVTWANKRGPRPVRSYVWPRGFTRLSWTERKRANWGNIMADFSFLAFAMQMKHVHVMALFENPEDLGAIKSGQNFGKRPGSMWQFQQFSEVLQQEQVTTAAFYQEDFGTDTLNPRDCSWGGLHSCRNTFWKDHQFLMTKVFMLDHWYNALQSVNWSEHWVIGLQRPVQNSGHRTCADGLQRAFYNSFPFCIILQLLPSLTKGSIQRTRTDRTMRF